MNDVSGSNSYVLIKNQNLMSLTLLPELNEIQWGEIEVLGAAILNQVDEFRIPVILVDLSGLNYMGSAMVALIVRIWKAVKSRNGKMAVVCPDPMVLQVLALAHLDKLWPITPTREEALKALGAREIVTNQGSLNSSGNNSQQPVSSPVTIIIAAIALIVGIAGVACIFARVAQIPPKACMGMALGGAGLGFILGLVSMITDKDYKKNIGLLSVIAGMILIIVTLISKPS